MTKSTVRIILFSMLLYGCQIMLEPAGEVVTTNMQIAEQDGKSVWLILRDSLGNDYSQNGIHKTKYSSYRLGNHYKMEYEFYDINGNLLDTSSALGYCRSIVVLKNGNSIDEYTQDENGKMIELKAIPYARLRRKYFKDGSWRERYYDVENKPCCNLPAFEYHFKWDTIWQTTEIDTSYMLRYNVIYKKDCDGNLIK